VYCEMLDCKTRPEISNMVGHEDVGVERHAIAVAIALGALLIGAVIRVVMEDRGAAIAAGEDMIEPAGDVEAWLAGHGGERGGWSCNNSIRMPDPPS